MARAPNKSNGRKTYMGWGHDKRAYKLLNIPSEARHRLAVLVLSMMIYWDTALGGYLAVAQVKPKNRRFAWGLESVLKIMHAIRLAQAVESKAVPDMYKHASHTHFLTLGGIIRMCPIPHVPDFCTKRGAEYWRAMFIELVIMLQPDSWRAKEFGIDVKRLAADVSSKLGIKYTVEDLFDLAERESLRAGCQFGLLLWVSRLEACERGSAAKAFWA